VIVGERVIESVRVKGELKIQREGKTRTGLPRQRGSFEKKEIQRKRVGRLHS